MNDKFIMMNLDDERSKKVAEVMKSEACKRILDYLAEIKEASETDISKNLNMPLNTVGYNLKKLLDSGLVEKTKNFFWSAKGKKIPMYKLARKHIVISPRSSRPNLALLKTIVPVILAVAIIAILIFTLPQAQEKESKGFKTFSSSAELKNFLEENILESRGSGVFDAVAGLKSAESSVSGSLPAGDYSKTNIQVEGVDEADIVKNDGKYIYAVSGNKVFIIDAFPAENMKIESEIDFSNENVQEIFVNDDKLVVFSNTESPVILYSEVRCLAMGCAFPPYESRTSVYVYDISNREKQELETNLSLSGNYFDSRMIGNYVYIISNQYIYPEMPVLPAITRDGNVKVIPAEEIYYPEIKDNSFQYTTILALNLDNKETSEKVLITGSTNTLYVSLDNIYTIYTKYPEWTQEIVEKGTLKEKTIINKISINKNDIDFLASGEVPGHVLNQFSMDEYNGNLRIATTIGELWNENEQSKNNVYVLDESLKTIGKLEDLAPGEKIYSSRFIGERAYLVTFKKIDPLFVVDLSNPANPNILGKLKIPGYSDYLHPYDENHIIGIGKEAVDASSEDVEQRNLDFAWYQGVKIAIFDVTDVANPIELHKIVIGDRGTDSEALQEHKAFLFDRQKELLVIPITLAEIPEERKTQTPPGGFPEYGETTFQGAYVYNINLEDGFKLKGRITHFTEEDELKRGFYYDWNQQIRRSLYMDNTLYTISNKVIKANALNNLDELSKIILPVEDGGYERIE